MTAENVNESSEEQQVESPEQEVQTVPLDKHVALRHRAQTAEIEAAELRGRVSALEQVNTTHAPAAKSPLELRAEEDDCSVGEVRMDGDLYQKQAAWDRQQENVNAQAVADKALAVDTFTSMNEAKIAHDDWQTVIDAGDRLLSAGEQLDIKNAGAKFGEVAYAKCKVAIERNKPVEEAAPKLSESEQKAKDEADAAKKVEEAAKGKSQDEILAEATAKSSDPHADFISTL